MFRLLCSGLLVIFIVLSPVDLPAQTTAPSSTTSVSDSNEKLRQELEQLKRAVATLEERLAAQEKEKEKEKEQSAAAAAAPAPAAQAIDGRRDQRAR
jgi:hypothetical protein